MALPAIVFDESFIVGSGATVSFEKSFMLERPSTTAPRAQGGVSFQAPIPKRRPEARGAQAPASPRAVSGCLE